MKWGLVLAYLKINKDIYPEFVTVFYLLIYSPKREKNNIHYFEKLMLFYKISYRYGDQFVSRPLI